MTAAAASACASEERERRQGELPSPTPSVWERIRIEHCFAWNVPAEFSFINQFLSSLEDDCFVDVESFSTMIRVERDTARISIVFNCKDVGENMNYYCFAWNVPTESSFINLFVYNLEEDFFVDGESCSKRIRIERDHRQSACKESNLKLNQKKSIVSTLHYFHSLFSHCKPAIIVSLFVCSDQLFSTFRVSVRITERERGLI